MQFRITVVLALSRLKSKSIIIMVTSLSAAIISATAQHPAPEAPESNPLAGCVLALRLNEGPAAGYCRDWSANASASAVDGAEWIPDTGGAYDFDGATGYLDAGQPAGLDFEGSFTIFYWFKLSSISSITAPVCKWDDVTGSYRAYAIFVGSDGGISFLISPNGSSAASVASITKCPVDSAWHCIAGVFRSGQSLTLYVDGKYDNTQSTAYTSVYSPAVNFLVGAGDLGESYRKYMDGAIDDVYVFNRALSAAEIQDLYQRGKSEGK